MAFFLTRDSVTHCHHSRVCRSHGVTAAAVQNKGTTETQRCNGSSQCSHLSLMAYLQSSTCGAWTVSYPIPTLICRTQLWWYVSCLNSDSLFISLSSYAQQRDTEIAENSTKKAGFSCVFLSSWEIHLKDSRGDSRTHSEHTYTKCTLHPHYPYKFQLLPVNIYPACEIWKHITNMRDVKIDELKLLTNY